MKNRKLLKTLVTGLLLSVFLFFLNSCNSSENNLNIKSAFLAKELPGGKYGKVGTTYKTDDGPFHLFVVFTDIPDSTAEITDSIKVKTSWHVVKIKNEDSGLINETEIVYKNETQLNFKLAFPHPWLPGKYKVDLYFNGKLDRSIPFDVKE